jgi:hypothetical protein
MMYNLAQPILYIWRTLSLFYQAVDNIEAYGALYSCHFIAGDETLATK